MRNKLKIWYYFKFKKKLRSIKYDLFDKDGLLKVVFYVYGPCLYYNIRFNLIYIDGILRLINYLDANEHLHEDDEDWYIREIKEYRDNYMYKYLTQKCQRYL